MNETFSHIQKQPRIHRRPSSKMTIFVLLLGVLACSLIILRGTYVYHTGIFKNRDENQTAHITESIQVYLDQQDLNEPKAEMEPGFTSFKLYGYQKTSEQQTKEMYEAYIWFVTSNYAADGAAETLVPVGFASIPAIVSLEADAQGGLKVTDFKMPRDGSLYEEDLRKFPWIIREPLQKDLESNEAFEKLEEANQFKAREVLQGV